MGGGDRVTNMPQRERSAVERRLQYWRRIFAAYLTSSKSQLTFWHDTPACNPELSTTELGQYYMPFTSKADYTGHYDGNGIPMLDYQGVVGLQYNPIAIAQYGLGNFNLYRRTGSADRCAKFKRVADWLVEKLEINPNGTWVWNHNFDWDYRATLKAPWYSALAQGQGISVLVRAYREFGKPDYLDAANRALVSFTRTVDDGGVQFLDADGNKWYEEYVVPPPPTHILNGFMWASWGLYDHHLATGDELSKGLFDDAVSTLAANLHRFDTGRWSLYEISGTRMKMLASPFYHLLHIAQLEVMHRLTGHPIFAEYRDKWERYLKTPGNRRFAVAYKSVFKLLYY